MDIIYEDNHILVVKKEPNIPVMGDESKDKDMLTMCKEYIKQKYNKPGNVFLGLVHRLDRPTGGVMVFARTSKAAARLSEGLKDGTVEKRYLAVLSGIPKEKQGRLTHYLLKDGRTNTVSVVPMLTEGAKKAVLDYKVVSETGGVLSLAKIDLYTGRSHQIRVQMGTLNAPVFGDVRYGGDKLAKGHNMALWAYEITFYHPITKLKMVFKCYPPIESVPWNKFEPIIKTIIA